MAQAFPPHDPNSDNKQDRDPDDARPRNPKGAQDDPTGDAYDALPDAFFARLVHELGQVVTASRRTIAIAYAARGVALPLPPTLDRGELRVLTALVQTYGVGVFRDDFSAVRQRLAECGAVVVLQQLVFADRPSRGRQRDGAGADGAGPGGSSVGGVTARLQAARPLFETLCARFPETFLVQARALLAHVARRPLPPQPRMPLKPPEPPLESEDGERDDA